MHRLERAAAMGFISCILSGRASWPFSNSIGFMGFSLNIHLTLPYHPHSNNSCWFNILFGSLNFLRLLVLSCFAKYLLCFKDFHWREYSYLNLENRTLSKLLVLIDHPTSITIGVYIQYKLYRSYFYWIYQSLNFIFFQTTWTNLRSHYLVS